MKKKKIAIIGFGRFGSLLLNFLKPFGEISVIDEGPISSNKITVIDYEDLKYMDWVILAVPISSLEKVLLKIKSHLRNGCLVMDVCSVKVYPCRLLKKHLPKNIEILGTHPMFGPDSAKNGLNNLQMVLCPLRISKNSLKEVLYVLDKLQLKTIETTPEEHDRQGAMNLSLVHFIGRGLGRIKMVDQKIKTVGYERLLAVNETVNNDTWQLFLDMQRFNPYARKVRNDFIRSLKYIDKKIN